MRTRSGNRVALHAQRGLSLFELLVAIVVLAALMAGISELVVTNTRNASATSNIARMQETGRTAMQLLTTDIRRAGYLGGNVYPNRIGGSLGTSDLDETCTIGDSNATEWGRMLQRPVFGLNDTNTAYAGCIANDDYLRGDILTVRYAEMPPLEDAAIVDARPYLRTTLVEGRVFNASTKTAAANVLNPDIARSYRVAAHTYFVSNTERSCGVDEDGIDLEVPGLFRMAIGDDGQPVEQELLAGVEHIQFRYKVGNAYLNADDVPDWEPGTVEAIETTVLVRSECPETGFINGRDFAMADIADYGPDDAFRRQVFTNITQVRNAGLQELDE